MHVQVLTVSKPGEGLEVITLCKIIDYLFSAVSTQYISGVNIPSVN